ncbi:MAG: class I SAM-dependent methyltransferase, partial [Saprospiraceae bacterium]|nr:class I SAM-dependent methyltransferase [Saprospiraceae bacterium]
NWENRLAFELPLIEKILGSVKVTPERPLQILDAACGTGMHALALAKAGYEVAGADFFKEMISKARQNARTAKLDLCFEVSGFGTLSETFTDTRFDALLCLGNSLPHVLSLDALQEAVKDFSDCLRPGGLLLIQNRNFDAVMHKKDRWMEPQVFHEGEEEWIFQRFYDFNQDSSIRFNIVNLYRQADSEWKSSVVSTRLMPQLRDEMESMLQLAGFSQVRSMGGLDGSAFDPLVSGNLILVARKG